MANKLFVGNLPFDATNEQLQQAFSQAGSVSEVFIPVDRESNRPRGFAFVTMSSDAEAAKAVEMFNGKDFGGRALVVNEARPKEDRTRNGGYGGGYGGGM